jgi:hypothetical protein
MTKPYYETLWARTEHLYAEPSECSDMGVVCIDLLMRSSVGLLEFMERQGEGCAYRQAYLDGGRKMD